MRSIVIIAFCVCLTMAAQAQLYKVELEGKYLPAKVIFGDGAVVEVEMMYQQPEFFKNPQNKFKLKRDGNDYSHTGGIEAFLIDNNVWALRNVSGQNQFVVLNRQGAVEQFQYIINGKFGEVKSEFYVVVGERSKTITRNNLKNESVEGDVSGEKIKEWIADSPEVVEDLRLAEEAAALAKGEMTAASGTQTATPAKKGLVGMIEKGVAKENEAKKEAATSVNYGRIINNYNVSYEQRNPGKIKYYFSPSMTWEYLPKKAKTQEELKAEKQAALDKLYANRSSSVSPEYASAKDNVPVKKETFDAKIKRIKADGNKIGVRLVVLPARTVQPESGTTQVTPTMQVEGEYMDESLMAAGQQFVDELNQLFNTTDFELIDMRNIPYREVKVVGTTTRIDDWWATKYKVVFAYTLDPRLEPAYQNSGGKTQWTVAVNMLQSLIATEYIGANNATKQDILTQILNMGGFRTPVYAQEEEIKDPKEMYEKAVMKLGMPMLDKVKTERADGLAKVTKKLVE